MPLRRPLRMADLCVALRRDPLRGYPALRRTFQYASLALLARLDLGHPERPFRTLKIANLCVAVLAVALWSGVAVAQEGRDAAQLLEDGRRAYEQEDFERARQDLWAYLDATASLTGASRQPQAEALYYIALMEPDASVAARHYKIIADEFPAASVADKALFRLAVYELVQGRAVEARGWLGEVKQNYPYSDVQPEIPLWMGRSYLAEGKPLQAADQFLAGFTGVKSGDLPRELPLAQREALAAEYAWWLATAYREADDERTATQYLSLLMLDYPNSPQAGEARVAQTEGGVPAGAGGELAVAEPPAEREAGEQEPAREEPVREEVPTPEPVREEPPEPVREEPPPEPVREEPPPEPVREEPPRQEPAREAESEERVVVQPIRPAPAPEEEARPVERPPEERRPPAREPRLVEGRVYLQIGAFTSATNAAELSKRLKADGFEPAVAIGIVDGRGYYRVRIGPFLVPEAAQRLAAVHSALISLGYPAEQIATD